MPLVQTRGAASAQGFGEFAQAATAVNYIEDVFSTYLYTGTGAALTITNNIDLSTNGGLTWIKGRSGATGHRLTDTARGVTKSLASNSDAAEATETTGLTAFGTTGFTIDVDADYNTSSATYVSWTFREQAKFFDVVTWSGNGTAGRNIAHNLGSVPGCIIVKRLNLAVDDWRVYHRSLGNTKNLVLNSTAAENTGTALWNSTTPTSTVFTVGNDTSVNSSGGSYVAYLFAHDAGGFGITGTDNVISCGTFTTDGAAAATVSLGYEPQWVLFKRTDSATNGDWVMFDNMRGLPATGSGSLAARLIANTAAAESPLTGDIKITSTGFVIDYVANSPFIYIAIRRGPMKVPTLGTTVFSPQIYTEIVTNPTKLTTSFPTDLHMISRRTGTTTFYVADRLRGSVLGNENFLETSSTVAETDYSSSPPLFTSNTGIVITTLFNNTSSTTDVSYQFRRAPSFMDVVCYTGTGSATTFSHNLGIVPELMIVKRRSATNAWAVYANNDNTDYLVLNTTAATADDATYWNDTSPTSSVFSVGTNNAVNASASTYVAYLFGTCSGVSKVGSYTGTATTLQIDCGFTAGARFVLIKRTDSTGDWYVWDSARGIIAGNDPYLLLNSTAAEVTGTDYVDTYNAGFELSSTAPAGLNANGGTYIFLAIA